MKNVKIITPYIQLDQLLKYEGIVSTGGEAKALIKRGKIWVNGESCIIQRKKIYPGDRVDIPDLGSIKIIIEE